MVDNILRGILPLHVDDGFHFGERLEYETSMNQLFEDFEIPPEKMRQLHLPGMYRHSARHVLRCQSENVR